MLRLALFAQLLLLPLVTHAQNPQEHPLKDSEWWPDSIYSPVTNHAREFLFFDKQGYFYRTTWEAERYIIDRKLTMTDTGIQRADSSWLRLTQLSDGSIELEGPDYYGLFHRDEMPDIATAAEGLNEFLVGDSLKQLILGSWQLQSIGIAPVNSDEELTDDLVAYEKSRDLFNMLFDEDMQLQFTADNALTLSFPHQTEAFEYFIDDSILYLSPYEQNNYFKYKLSNGKLWLTEDHPDYPRTLVFGRKE